MGVFFNVRVEEKKRNTFILKPYISQYFHTLLYQLLLPHTFTTTYNKCIQYCAYYQIIIILYYKY